LRRSIKMTIKLSPKQIYWITLLILTLSITGFAQTDAEKFAEGRVALDKFKDCPASLQALEGVSAEGRKNPLWVYYMAQANECLRRLSDAVHYCEQYDRLSPGAGGVLDTSGGLSCQLGVKRRREDGERATVQKAEREGRAGEREKGAAWTRLGA